ncbi:nucleoid-associated protein [Parachitinimonas caeni]|uniref:Nucleoid-associated protein n=1 Tax=Parachitinimonas caeni TaxID=3031301 RepID=A0ABT7DYS5_9NEIS|nr:nucleoid-associated protein [Parachitinimonas caeni]MDK2125220.1 nucleoid-associated protein [Parachitinimonas caeni]
MQASPLSVSHVIVHQLSKSEQGEASVRLRDTPLPLNAAAQRLVEQLVGLYTARLGKSFGQFEEDEASFPLPRWLRQYLQAQSLDFSGLSAQMAEALRQRLEQEALATGGYLLIAHAKEASSDSLLVALLTEAQGSALTAELDVTDCSYLDLSSLKVAGRIDLTAWQQGGERYISFLKGKGDVAQYFKQFLGCSDVVSALKETQKLVQGLGQFVESRKLQPAQRDEILERAHSYLEGLGEQDVPWSLDEVAQQVWPQEPACLRRSFDEQAIEVSGGFVPDKRAIKPLVRFKAQAQQWKLEFDRNSLRSGAVIYNKHNDTLVLYDVPEHLKRALLEGSGEDN